MVEKFLIDANTFITPYRQYYAFDLLPHIGLKYRNILLQEDWFCLIW